MKYYNFKVVALLKILIYLALVLHLTVNWSMYTCNHYVNIILMIYYILYIIRVFVNQAIRWKTF